MLAAPMIAWLAVAARAARGGGAEGGRPQRADVALRATASRAARRAGLGGAGRASRRRWPPGSRPGIESAPRTRPALCSPASSSPRSSRSRRATRARRAGASAPAAGSRAPSAGRTALLAAACAALPLLGVRPRAAARADRRASRPPSSCSRAGRRSAPARRARARRARARRSASRARWRRGSPATTAISARALHQPGLRALQARRAGGRRARGVAPCGASTRRRTPTHGRPRACPARRSRSRSAADGVVLAKGTVNDARQLALARRRGARAARAAQADVAARVPRPRRAARGDARPAPGMVGAVIRPGEAEAYHFCGHIYTTDGCPHPTGLPRIDRRGLPLRARDGRQVDDLGRLIDAAGPPGRRGRRPAHRPRGPPAARRAAHAGLQGHRRAATASASRPTAPGTAAATAACASSSTAARRTASGSTATASLTGYCYDKRKVFCVMYFQSTVPC